MNRIKRCKPVCYINKDEYKCIFEEKVNNVSQLTNITEIMNKNDYLDFADDVQVNGKHNEIVIRKVYAKNYYGDIKHRLINNSFGVIATIKLDRNNIIEELKHRIKDNNIHLYKILAIDNNIIEVEINVKDPCISRVIKSIRTTNKKHKDLIKEGYKILYEKTGSSISKIIEELEGPEYNNIEYIIIEVANRYNINLSKHIIYAHPDTDFSEVKHRRMKYGLTYNRCEFSNIYVLSLQGIPQHIKNIISITDKEIYYDIHYDTVGYVITFGVRSTIDKNEKILLLEKEIADKQKELDKLKEELNKFPKYNDTYYTINIDKYVYKDSTYDQIRKNNGNCFKTKEEIQTILNKMLREVN